MKKQFTRALYTGVLALFCSSTMQAQQIIIKLPQVPEVPKVMAEVPEVITVTPSPYITLDGESKTNAQIIEESTRKEVVVFSNHVAPNLKEKQDNPNKVVEIGEVKNGRVTAYLHAPLISVEEVIKKLQDAHFKIVETYKVDKKGLATSIVFTNVDLIKEGSKSNRGFASSLRVTVDKKNNLISITNPVYAMAAFMQKEYNQELAYATLKSLRDSFANLENSNELIKFRVLERFQFMEGMPKYGDMQVIKKDANKNLLASVRKSKKLVFEQKLANGSYLIGVKLSKRTSKFIKKTGYQNAGLLPYPVLIENGEAKILDPKYYIAIMYPLLKMSQFMMIATVPGAINKDVDKAFR